jgi:hypothetical protein
MMVPERPLALAADPLRPSAGGAEPDVATSGTLCRFVTAHARTPSLALGQTPRLRRVVCVQPRRQDPTRHQLVRASAGPEPRAPSVSSILDLAAERRVSRSLLRSREAPRTLVARFVRPVLVQERPPTRAISRCLGLPLGSPKKREKDASHRLLQSTHDTSTRRPLDYRAHDLRRADPASPPACRTRSRDPESNERSSCVAPDHLATIRPRLASRLTAQDQLRSGAARCYRLVPSRGSKRRGALSWVPASPERCLLR